MKTKDILALRPLFRQFPVRISDGPNQGVRWSAATRRAFRRGYFEKSRVEVISQLAEGCKCFWDAGAHFGYITLAASRRVQAEGRVIAIECNRDNLWYLRKHIQWNQLANVTIMPVAIGNSPGHARFNPVSSGTGLVEGAEFHRGYDVEVETIDNLTQNGRLPPPDVFKVDIDHTYVDFLAGARETLRHYPTLMVLATNNSKPYHIKASETLRSWGYEVHTPLRCEDAETFHGIESELLAIGPGRIVEDKIIHAFKNS